MKDQEWSPSQFQFNPYELEATRVPENAQIPFLDSTKRKAGRQKRASVLCQVCEDCFLAKLAKPEPASLDLLVLLFIKHALMRRLPGVAWN